MKFGYLDPPYLHQCHLYKHNHPSGDRPFDGRCWNDLETHRLLIDWASVEYPDGWALSSSSPALFEIAPFFLDDARVGAWIKPFASFKPGINPGYCWEPLIWRGGRRLGRDIDTVRDFCVAPIELIKGQIGAKPTRFCAWVLDLLGYEPGDQFEDVFAGSGVFGKVRDGHRQLGFNLSANTSPEQ